VIAWVHHKDGDVYHALVRFITQRVWGRDVPMSPGTILAVLDGADIIGACLFHNYDADNGVIELTSASASPKWLSRAVLAEIFGYAFDQMRCQAAIMRVDSGNTRMCRIATAFGFKRYDIPRLRGRDKAEAIFILGDDEWRGGKFHQRA
jgi:RimJ/RimL family protein N-acetyltransferase